MEFSVCWVGALDRLQLVLRFVSARSLAARCSVMEAAVLYRAGVRGSSRYTLQMLILVVACPDYYGSFNNHFR